MFWGWSSNPNVISMVLCELASSASLNHVMSNSAPCSIWALSIVTFSPFLKCFYVFPPTLGALSYNFPLPWLPAHSPCPLLIIYFWARSHLRHHFFWEAFPDFSSSSCPLSHLQMSSIPGFLSFCSTCWTSPVAQL